MQTRFIYEMTVDKYPCFFLSCFFSSYLNQISSSHIFFNTKDFTTQEREGISSTMDSFNLVNF